MMGVLHVQGDAEQFWSANLRMRPAPRGDRPTAVPLRLYIVRPAEGTLPHVLLLQSQQACIASHKVTA